MKTGKLIAQEFNFLKKGNVTITMHCFPRDQYHFDLINTVYPTGNLVAIKFKWDSGLHELCGMIKRNTIRSITKKS